MFTFDYNKSRDSYEIASREFEQVKRRLLFQLTNFGQPIIDVVDGTFENRGELYLVHRHEGIDLDIPYAEETLSNLHTIWGRPVHLEGVVEGKGQVLFSHGPDGGEQQKLATTAVA
jgi:stage V sporulation protein R